MPGGSLAFDPTSSVGARPRDQAGDASPRAIVPSVAVTVVVAAVAVGHGPVAVGVKSGAQAGDAATAPWRSLTSSVVAAARAVVVSAVVCDHVVRPKPAEEVVRPANAR